MDSSCKRRLFLLETDVVSLSRLLFELDDDQEGGRQAIFTINRIMSINTVQLYFFLNALFWQNTHYVIFFEHIFNDRRIISLLLFLWASVSCLTFTYIMVADRSPFLNIGPNSENQLFGVILDSWFKWWCVAIYSFISTAIAAFASDSIVPWITNTIQDHKTKYIPYSPVMCWAIIQVFTFYAVTQSVIGLFVALTQVDFMLIRLAADIVVNHFTTFWFLKNKIYDKVKYDGIFNDSNSTDTECQALAQASRTDGLELEEIVEDLSIKIKETT